MTAEPSSAAPKTAATSILVVDCLKEGLATVILQREAGQFGGSREYDDLREKRVDKPNPVAGQKLPGMWFVSALY